VIEEEHSHQTDISILRAALLLFFVRITLTRKNLSVECIDEEKKRDCSIVMSQPNAMDRTGYRCQRMT